MYRFLLMTTLTCMSGSYSSGQTLLNSQQPPTLSSKNSFDITSVHKAKTGIDKMSLNDDANHFLALGFPLKFVLMHAFSLHENELINLPKWADEERFDIIGKMDTPAEYPNYKESGQVALQRLRALLVDRFALHYHSGTLTAKILELHVDKSKRQLVKSSEDKGYITEPRRLKCSHCSINEVADFLSSILGIKVIDRTGLTGDYQFDLRWRSDDDTDLSLPTLTESIQDTLGLKMVSAKGSIATMVIDSIQHPDEN